MDGFIADFFLDSGTHEGADCFGGEEVDLPAEKVFKEKAELNEVVVVLLPLIELHDQVDVALLTLLAPDVGAEQPDPPHAMADQKIIVFSNAGHYLIAGH